MHDTYIQFAFAFYHLNKMTAEIVQFLYNQGMVFNGGFSKMTVALGRKNGPNGDASNVRNSCLRLEAAEAIHIEWEKRHTVQYIQLNPDWYLKILDNIKILDKTIPQMERIRIAETRRKITTICYGQRRDWNSKEEAFAYFHEAVNNSQGAEQERYISICNQIASGASYCSDIEMEEIK